MRLIDADAALETIRTMQTYKLFAGDDMILIDKTQVQTELMMLPSAQPETCGDAVSREAVLSMIDTYMNKSVELHYLPTSDGIKKLISILPSAQSERKTGRWLPDNTDYYRTRFICSACGESEEVPTTGFGYGTIWDYCPMCGAKMERGEQE